MFIRVKRPHQAFPAQGNATIHYEPIHVVITRALESNMYNSSRVSFGGMSIVCTYVRYLHTNIHTYETSNFDDSTHVIAFYPLTNLLFRG